MQATEDGACTEIAWSNSNHWVEASIALLGSKGSMLATCPCIVAHAPSVTVQRNEDGSLEPIVNQSSEDTSNKDEHFTDGQSSKLVLVSRPAWECICV